MCCFLFNINTDKLLEIEMDTSVKNYNFLSRVLHWLSAICIVGLFAVGLWMVDLGYYSEWYRIAPNWHKSIGILLIALTIFRILWLLFTGKPKPISSHSAKVKLARAKLLKPILLSLNMLMLNLLNLELLALNLQIHILVQIFERI